MAAEEQAQVEQPLGPREGDEQLVDHHRGRAQGHDGRVLHTQERRALLLNARLQGSAKKAWLFAKLQPGRARKRINAT